MMRPKTLLVLSMLLFSLLIAACQPNTPAQAPLRSPQPPTPLPQASPISAPTKALPSPSPTISDSVLTPAATQPPAHPTAQSDQGVVLGAIWIYSDQSGWASDPLRSRVYHTFDGGKTWRDVSPALTRGQNFFFFLDGSTAWISQNVSEVNSFIWHSTDGGVKWLRFSQDTPGGLLSFSNTLNGFMLISLELGMGQQSVEIRQTADGGATWSVRWRHLPDEQDPSLPVSGNKENLVVLNDNNLLVDGTWPVPKSLYAYRSEDAAFSWKQLQCGGLPELGEGDMWAAQMPMRTGGNTLVMPVRAFASVGVDKTYFCGSNDGGSTWTYLSQLDATSLHSFTNTGVGFSAGSNNLYRSVDGGLNWQALPFRVPEGQAIISLSVAGDKLAYLLLSSLQPGPYAPAFLYATTDGGQTWEFVPSEIVN